jgi:hypothetical protein
VSPRAIGRRKVGRIRGATGKYVACGALAAALAVASGPPAAGRGIAARELANHCFVLRSASTGQHVVAAGDGYRVDQRRLRSAAAFFLKPSGLGRYLPFDGNGLLISARDADGVGRDAAPGPPTEWAISRASKRAWALRSTATGRQLARSSTGSLVTGQPGSRGADRLFTLVRARGCRAFPEAAAGATGPPSKGAARNGTVAGFADVHLHITADQRAGGRVVYGEPFNRFGIAEALGHDADDHGSDGSLDITGNLLRNGTPTGTHDTHGWPTFAGWPTFDTNTHTQAYYVWLKRAWMAGERLVVAQTVEDEPLCRLEALRARPSCDETESIRLQIRELRGLQDYVDAQAGGRGRGWFRLVYDPAQARRVIKRGQLAVVIGIESSDLFGCSERLDQPQCTRADIDRGLDEFHRLGVRSLFPVHWVDNAFGGAAIEGGDKGTFISVMELQQTGHPFRTGPCPEAGQGEEGLLPGARECNTKGLTDLGEHLIRRMIDRHMLIDVDHLSERARLRVLDIAEAERYPLVSSHTNTGGLWTASDLNRLYALGGLASARPAQAKELAAEILEHWGHRSGRFYSGVPLGTDTGGFSTLPAPRPDAGQVPLRYPFRLYQCKVTFGRQRSGARTYDLNTDGVAHYGLYADLLADMQQRTGTRAFVPLLRSAEAYLQMWGRAESHL